MVLMYKALVILMRLPREYLNGLWLNTTPSTNNQQLWN